MAIFIYRGVYVPPLDHVTSDGFDMQWGTNVVGTALRNPSISLYQVIYMCLFK